MTATVERSSEMHIFLEAPSGRRREEFLAAVVRSRGLHRHWVAPPRTAAEFDAFMAKVKQTTHIAYWICMRSGDLAGVIHISEIVRGSFQSGYLGYYDFAPHQGHGYMREGLSAVISGVFRAHGLHRLEANIQPDNEASLRLVRPLRFQREGFSRRYLKGRTLA
jgi:[ribosomal protein S5]-alanine N-acetyltransferase